MNERKEQIYAILAGFANPGMLLEAARKVREAGYTRFDCHSPYTIHGMDEAMGLKRSPIGIIAGVAGLTGALLGYILQWWTSAVSYPITIGGKPYNSFQAFVPITFGIGVLVAALTAFFSMLVSTGLPRWFHGLFYAPTFSHVTADGLFVSIEASDPKFDPEKTKVFLQSIGGTGIEIVRGE
jgi:hypothetical protein